MHNRNLLYYSHLRIRRQGFLKVAPPLGFHCTDNIPKTLTCGRFSYLLESSVIHTAASILNSRSCCEQMPYTRTVCEEYSRQSSGSSAPSLQSFSPSHFHRSGMQRSSVGPHLNCAMEQLDTQVWRSDDM